MICIVCLDNSGGMMFNHRRQSKDSAVIADIEKAVASATVFLNSYSAKLFENSACKLTVAENFLEIADEDFCFVEDKTLAEYEEKIQKIIVYRWNRDYPSDFSFDIDLSEWSIAQTESFSGTSHEEITKEVYIK
ncbi:MAG: ribonuclease Z [Ruminococcus sp.]|nr:ribonuclease Z [Candidatus Copronaster equi]